MVIEQSMSWLHALCAGVPFEHVPPLVARGQSPPTRQVWLVCVEQVPTFGQFTPGLVQVTLLPYLQSPTDAQGVATLQVALVAEQIPLCVGQLALLVHVPPVKEHVPGSCAQSVLVAQMVMLSLEQ